MLNISQTDRLKEDIARLVDAALELQSEFGTRPAAAFLHAGGADFRLTVRVLLEPGQRRRTKRQTAC
jgi:hypothetical protein